MKYIVIESGSKGNATLIEHQGRILLIDMGISLKSLKSALAGINKKLLDIDALLLTHRHSDHTAGIRYLDPLPIYCTDKTYCSQNCIDIEPYKAIQIECFSITPLSTCHDALNSVGFKIDCDNETLIYMTDTGMIPEESLSYMKNADYYIIESNHNVKMLRQSNRPACLKLRILSDDGHLSNEDSAIYMSELIGDKTKEITLAHLSEECNTPELALKAYSKVFSKMHIKLDKILLRCANQHVSLTGGK